MEKAIQIIKFIKAYLQKNYPSHLIFFVTSKCNADCKFCFNWKNIEDAEKRKELTLEEINKISKSFRYLVQLTISGGEPFLRDELSEIVYLFYKNSGAFRIAIPTNGILSEKIEEIVRRILKKCDKNINLLIGLSIDGIGINHDEIRHSKENFKRLLETYNRLELIRKKDKNLIIYTDTVISYFNKI